MPTDMDLVSFCNRYMDHAQMRFVRKVFVEKKSLCLRFLEMCGNMPVGQVTSAMVEAYLTKQAKARSANAYNKDRKNLAAMWAWGVKILDLPNNPVSKIDKLPHTRKTQYTPLTEDILRVLAAAKPEEKIFLNAYLQTGARRSEIFRWTWHDDINFESREVRLGTRKTKDGSMEYEWLPMSDELHEDLWWWWNNRPIKKTPYVFVSTGNRHYGQPFTTRRRFMKGICERAGVKPFGFHALRRYVASVLSDTHKISTKTIQRILRHKNMRTTELYIKNLNRDLSAILNLLSVRVPQEVPHSTAKG